MTHFSAGGSTYQLYHGEGAIVSKVTARKIKGFWKDGELDFLLEEPRVAEVVEGISRAIDAEAQQEQAARVGLSAGEILSDVQRREVIDSLPELEWSVRGLEAAGFIPEEAVSLLAEWDELNLLRVHSVFRAFGKAMLGAFNGIQQYVALHFKYQYRLDYPDAPGALLDRASELYAKGLLGSNAPLKAAGANIVRYQIWRGAQYLQAYVDSIERMPGSRMRNRLLFQELRSLIGQLRSQPMEELNSDTEEGEQR